MKEWRSFGGFGMRDGPISHRGKYYSFDDIEITPKPVQPPLPAYIGSFSKPSIELAARLGCGVIVAPFAAAISYGGLRQVADAVPRTCAKAGTKPGRLMCSYFTHFADDPAQELAARERQVRYYRECVIPSFPSDPATAPPSYRYFIDMVERLRKVKPEDLTENSVLIGAAAAHHRDSEKGRGRWLRRGDPLFQCRPEASPTGARRNVAIRGRGETGIRSLVPPPIPAHFLARAWIKTGAERCGQDGDRRDRQKRD